MTKQTPTPRKLQALPNLRVLFLASRDWYNPATTGGDNTLWENARYLASVGHKVTFVCSRFPGAQKTERIDGIEVVRIGSLHSLWIRTFFEYIRRRRGTCDVVVVEGFGGSRIPRLAPLYVREPIITEWHQIHTDLFKAQYPRWLVGPLNVLERFTALVHRGTLIRAGTTEWAHAFQTLGFRAEHIFILPVSIRSNWLEPSAARRMVTPTIVWLGKFRRYKCPHHIVMAMPGILAKVPRAKLVLAGRHDDRAYEDALAEAANQLDISESVHFRFDVTESEKRDLLEEATTLVLPSAVEGFGIVVLEANACGTPVIASDRVPEGAVRDGFNGLRYPFGDTTELAERVVRIMGDSQIRGKLSSNGLQFASSFRWESVGAKFEAIVEYASGRVPSAR